MGQDFMDIQYGTENGFKSDLIPLFSNHFPIRKDDIFDINQADT